MTSTPPITSKPAPAPAETYPRPAAPGAPDIAAAKNPTHHHFVPPPHVKIPFFEGNMGAAPLQAVEVIQLLAGLPANLGPNVDTTA